MVNDLVTLLPCISIFPIINRRPCVGGTTMTPDESVSGFNRGRVSRKGCRPTVGPHERGPLTGGIKCFKLSALSFKLKTIIKIKSRRYLSVFRIIGLVPGSLHGYHGDELNAQVIHQVIIIAAQFIFILFFPEIIFDFVFVSLECGYDI
jgi:hypothetical protein